MFHDLGNINFTFICNDEDYDLNRQLNVIKEACKGADIDTEFSGRNDILAQGRKFSGNAFYSSAKKSFHHGTILLCADTGKMSKYLTPSKAKLSSKGIKSVKSRVVNLKELNPALTPQKMKEYMINAFETVYGMNAEIKEIKSNDKIESIAKQYACKEYLYGMAIPFTLTCEKRFDWGGIQINLNVKHGVITDAQIFSDAMDHTLSDKIKTALLNRPFEKDAIKKVVDDDIYSMFFDILP